MPNEIANDLYEGTAKLGKIQSYVSLIVIIIIGVILILCSFNYFFSNEKYNVIRGKIESIKCNTTTINNKPQTSCTLELSYTIDGIKYKSTLNTNTSTYSSNQEIDIEYLESNRNNIRIPSLSNQMIGLISSGVALVIIGGAYYNYYLTTESKVYASSQGVSTIYNKF